jgi:hypothetical protein
MRRIEQRGKLSAHLVDQHTRIALNADNAALTVQRIAQRARNRWPSRRRLSGKTRYRNEWLLIVHGKRGLRRFLGSRLEGNAFRETL